MIKIGDRVIATVYREEPYGVFLRFESEELFVHLPELSWIPCGPANTRGLLNKRLPVLILGYHPRNAHWYGSVRKAEPEKNPYLALNDLTPGTLLIGEIYGGALGTCAVRLESGAIGWLPSNEVKRRPTKGEKLAFTIYKLDAVEGKLELRLAPLRDES